MNHTLNPATKELLEKKRLIFTVATGRCGTAYLSHLLTFLPGVCSLHEPEPEYYPILRKVQGDPALAYRFLAEEKLPRIASQEAPVYAEASHLFCKGFIEPFLEMGLTADMILLSRSRDAVASSLYRSGTIPGRSERGLQFYLSPDDPVQVPLANWEKLHDYQLCYWYILEIEARADLYEKRFLELGSRVVRVRLEEIRTLAGFRRLYRSLELRGPTPRKWLSYFRYGRSKVNAIASEKKENPLPENVGELKEEVFALLDRPLPDRSNQ